MATAGYRGRVYMGGGSTTITEQAMVDTGDGLTWEIATRPVLDPGVAIVVEVDDGGGYVTVDADDYEIDLLWGAITFTSTQAGNDVRISGASLALLTLLEVKNTSLMRARQELDSTTLGDDATDCILGLLDVTGTISRLEDGGLDHDPGAGTATIEAALNSGALKILQFRPSLDSLVAYRAWVRFSKDEVGAEVASLVTATLTFKGALPAQMKTSCRRGTLPS